MQDCLFWYRTEVGKIIRLTVDMADTEKTPHSQLCKSRSDLTAWHNELSGTSLWTLNVVWLEHFTSLQHLFQLIFSGQNIVRSKCVWLAYWVDCTAFPQILSNLHHHSLQASFLFWSLRIKESSADFGCISLLKIRQEFYEFKSSFFINF